MKLMERQQIFARHVALLILYAESLGFRVTFGDAFRDPRADYGHPRSLHRQRLAVDLNLFEHGEYRQSSAAHLPLGVWWESLSGYYTGTGQRVTTDADGEYLEHVWGGKFAPTPDGNHYSIAYGGMK